MSPQPMQSDQASPADGGYEFFRTAVPLPITGAAGFPANPIAVK